MSVTYYITYWPYITAMKAKSFKTCKRAPRARYLLESAVYEMLKDASLLDRPIAHTLMQEVADCTIAPPRPGYWRFQKFKLADGAFVTFEAGRY